ncbi:MAG: hypothetical protein PHX04_04715 [Bacilli bacterium]|nr:hypothetical protein [Bacilli bacterium]
MATTNTIAQSAKTTFSQFMIIIEGLVNQNTIREISNLTNISVYNVYINRIKNYA